MCQTHYYRKCVLNPPHHQPFCFHKKLADKCDGDMEPGQTICTKIHSINQLLCSTCANGNKNTLYPKSPWPNMTWEVYNKIPVFKVPKEQSDF